MRWTMPVATLFFLSLFAGLPALKAQEHQTSKTESSQSYDDKDQRILAEVELKLVDVAGQSHVQIRISAVGPNVHPVAGWRGVRGANLVTAQQLDKILAGRFPVVVATRSPSRNSPVYGKITTSRFQRLPIRLLDAKGRIDFTGLTKEKLPRTIVLDTGPVKPGLHITDFYLNDALRMQIEFQVGGHDVQVIAFHSLEDPRHRTSNGDKLPPPAAPMAVAKAQLAVQPQVNKQVPLPAPVSDAEWNKRDLEGKWVMYLNSLSQGGNARAWLQFLEKRKDFEFLEMIAIYKGSTKALKILSKAKAPQWMRVAIWLRRAYPSLHAPNDTHWMITGSDPAFAYSYLKKYKAEVDKSKPLQHSFNELAKANLPPVDVSSALPPLKVKNVFRHMKPAKKLGAFGNRLRAEAAKQYVHQVVRAIDGFVLCNQYSKEWMENLYRLTEHENLKVRQAAYLAFTHFPAYRIDQKMIPFDSFLPIADDAKETPAIREAALMAYSYFEHPKVYLKLLHLAKETGHPAWNAAVSRLGDFGHDFAIRRLGTIDTNELTAKKSKLVDAVRDRLENYIRRRDAQAWASFLPRWLEYAAWAESTNDPLALEIVNWTKQVLSENGDAKFSERLAKIAKSYTPDFPLPKSQSMLFAQRVRQMAREIGTMRRMQ